MAASQAVAPPLRVLAVPVCPCGTCPCGTCPCGTCPCGTCPCDACPCEAVTVQASACAEWRLECQALEPQSTARLANGSVVAAWMLKANPAVWDIGSAIEQRLSLDWWRLAPTYRVDLVREGDPCVLWITRGDARVQSGIWGIGRIAGEPVPGVGDPYDPLWVDGVARNQVRPRVPVEMRVLVQPIPREEIASDPRLSRLEILRVPRIGNPAAIGPDEWKVIRELVQ